MLELSRTTSCWKPFASHNIEVTLFLVHAPPLLIAKFPPLELLALDFVIFLVRFHLLVWGENTLLLSLLCTLASYSRLLDMFHLYYYGIYNCNQYRHFFNCVSTSNVSNILMEGWGWGRPVASFVQRGLHLSGDIKWLHTEDTQQLRNCMCEEQIQILTIIFSHQQARVLITISRFALHWHSFLLLMHNMTLAFLLIAVMTQLCAMHAMHVQ